MPRKKDSLGRSLIKDRFAKRDRRSDSYLHVAELNDGYDWGRLNLQSVTEQSSFQEFLSTAELAGTEFQAEKLNITFVNPKAGVGLLSKDEYKKYEKNKEEKKDLLKIPRRPPWNEEMSAEELQNAERESFLEWRRGLAALQEEENMMLTPYEKNLDFWRQLWRVIERSDVVVQILDARNPLLFRCEDLEKYVNELNKDKINMLLLNKADFLTEEQRSKWAKYFDNVGIKAAFFSAKEAALEVIEEDDKDKEMNDDSGNPESLKDPESEEEEYYEDSSETDENNSETGEDSSVTVENHGEHLNGIQNELNTLNLKNSKPAKELIQDDKEKDFSTRKTEDDLKPNANQPKIPEETSKIDKYNLRNSPQLLGRDDLINLFREFTQSVQDFEEKGHVTIGLVGYPNVGKSSTINALLADKKVSVSATPGKTKHFQTLFLRKDVVLCDCPGLVMPSFVSTKAEMVLNGILPIDQMRDHVSPTALLASLIPRDLIEAEYGIMIPRPPEGEDPDRPPTPEELLNSYAYCRGFMTNNGQPDNPRASRYVLKDFVTGRLLYCVAPPGESQEEFHKFNKKIKKPVKLTPQAIRAVTVVKSTGADVDKMFFNKNSKGVHQKGVQKIDPSQIKPGTIVTEGNAKPWKCHKEKRNKKEKLRRVYRYLDE